jgi:hypothetical protein
MRYKIGFDESSKAVTGHVTVESDDKEQALEEAKELFTKVYTFAQAMSIKKLGN